MNPNSLISHSTDLFLASHDPSDARCHALPSPAHAPMTWLLAADPDDEATEEEEEEEEDDELDDEDEGADEDDIEQTAEPDGQFPDAPDTLKDTERPGGTQNRHGDRGGTS